jgi:cephalosporin-C deacetylase
MRQMTFSPAHSYPFDPAHGYDLDRLRAIRPPEEPAGFDAFWRRRYLRARAVDPRPLIAEAGFSHPDWAVFDIAFTSTGAFSIGGWLLTPRSGTIARGLVVGHGYGGRDQPDFDLPVEDTAVLFPCFRGLSRSAHPPISTDPAWHVLHDIDKPESYIIAGCVEDLWVSVTALLALYPQIAGRVGYAGISLGGGIGALAIPHDPRIVRGFLEVPTFGNRPLWLTLPSVGSAASVQSYARAHPDVAETLRFYDAAIAASRITVPMLAAVAGFDPAVAPACQFSIANALPSSKDNETFILDAGHFEYDRFAEQHAALSSRVGRFFRAT